MLDIAHSPTLLREYRQDVQRFDASVADLTDDELGDRLLQSRLSDLSDAPRKRPRLHSLGNENAECRSRCLPYSRFET